MSKPDGLLREALERQVPTRPDRRPDWDDVLARTRRSRTDHPRRLVAAGVLVAALVAGASALAAAGHSPFGAISSWLNGAPGAPASPAESAGFTARNGASYAAFPGGIEVRRVARETAGTKTFTLLGFASGGSLCLRLVRIDLPAERGSNECVTRAELDSSPAPALVASEARFLIGTPRRSVDGIYGFADDTVTAVEYRRGHVPWRRVPVENNVFLALDALTPGTFRHPKPVRPIVQVRAVTRSSARVPVQFVAGYTSYAAGLPTGPSYLAPSPMDAEQLPGPKTASHPLHGGTIGWLVRGEKRGEAWQPVGRGVSHLGTLVRSRLVQPEPGDPARVGLFLVRIGSGTRMHVSPGKVVLCLTELRPLAGSTGASCVTRTAGESLFGQRPFADAGFDGSQRTHLVGAAADGVAAMRLFLASGRVVPVALRDNVYSVSAPFDQFPAKLVAYDGAGRPVALTTYPGPLRPRPCPTVTPWPASKLPEPRSYQRLDLGALRVNGATIFGRSPAEVEAALGKPDRVARFSINNGHDEPTLFYGGSLPGNAELTVHFGWHQHRPRADTLSFHGRGLVDDRIGRVLNMTPQTLQAKIGATYGSMLRFGRFYGSMPTGFGNNGCTGEFRNTAGVVRVEYGVEPYAGGRPFLSLSHPY